MLGNDSQLRSRRVTYMCQDVLAVRRPPRTSYLIIELTPEFNCLDYVQLHYLPIVILLDKDE
jgi:hypothetical protein